LSQKLDRKELKRPDDFQVVAGRTMEWLVDHRKPVLAGLAAAVAVALAAWGAAAYSSSREAKAGAALAAALELEQRPIAGEAPPVPGVETFPSKAERSKAAMAALEKVRADAARTTAARTALAQIGFAKLRDGDAAGAQAALQEFLKEGEGHPLRAFALESLGYAYEAQGKLDEAKATFAKLSDAGGPDRAAFQQARLALVENKPEAKQQLAQVAKDFAKEPVALEANMRLEVASLPPPSSTRAIQPEQPAPNAKSAGKKK
jgi:hypothetical protein